MIVRHARSGALVLLAAAALAGCTKVKDQQGYYADEALIAAIQPGVDNRDSVMSTLGRPTFTGQFSPNDWYYVSRQTKNLAFNDPQPDTQTILRVRFDDAGNVTSVDRRGVEQIASVSPSGDKTPTLGRERSLLEELFGNVGAAGIPGAGAGTTDNPK